MALIPTLSTHLFAFSALDKSLLRIVADTGFRSLEIFAAPQHFPWKNGTKAEKALVDIESSGIDLRAIHAPFYDSLEDLRAGRTFALGDRDMNRRRAALDAIDRVLAITAGFKRCRIILHMGTRGPGDTDAAIFFDGVKKLLDDHPGRSRHLLLENRPGEGPLLPGFDGTACGIGEGLCGFCLDLGHLLLDFPGVPSLGLAGREQENPKIAGILEKTEHLHVHDNNGKNDGHLPPGQGIIDWEIVMKRLGAGEKERGFSLEMRDPSSGSLPLSGLLEQTLAKIQGPVRRFLLDKEIKL